MEGKSTGCSAADMRKGGEVTGQRRASGVCLGMIELGRGGKTAGVRTLRARVWRNLDGPAITCGPPAGKMEKGGRTITT